MQYLMTYSQNVTNLPEVQRPLHIPPDAMILFFQQINIFHLTCQHKKSPTLVMSKEGDVLLSFTSVVTLLNTLLQVWFIFHVESIFKYIMSSTYITYDVHVVFVDLVCHGKAKNRYLSSLTLNSANCLHIWKIKNSFVICY